MPDPSILKQPAPPEPLVPVPCWGHALSGTMEDWHIPSSCSNPAEMHPLLLPKDLVSNWRIMAVGGSVERQRDPPPIVPELDWSSGTLCGPTFSPICLSLVWTVCVLLCWTSWAVIIMSLFRATVTFQGMWELMKLSPQVVDICYSCGVVQLQQHSYSMLWSLLLALLPEAPCAWIVPVRFMSLLWPFHCTLPRDWITFWACLCITAVPFHWDRWLCRQVSSSCA